MNLRCSAACLATLMVTVLVLNPGCAPEDRMLDFAETDIAKIKVDDLTRAMDFISAEVRFDQEEFRDQVTDGLNRWVTYADTTTPWQLDPMLADVVKSYPELPVAERMADFKFLNTDPYYLQQCYWLTQLTGRLSQSERLQIFELYRLAADNYRPGEEVQDPIQQTLKRLHPELQGEDLEKLVGALQLFDWVCRNVQLESDAPLSDEERDRRRLNDSQDPAAAGIPGLGYQRFPWQVMMYGRGDYVERAKLILAGLKFLDIDAVMLATGTTPTPWAIGVPINGQYYLLDTKLALPIPGERPGSIATLQEVRENPARLDALDLTTEESLADDTDYWIKADQLDQVTALIYTTPESVSKRMKLMESALVGDDRLRMFFTAEELADRLPEAEGVTPQAWDIAFQTHQFRQAVRSALTDGSGSTSDKLKWYYLTEAYINGFRPYRSARGRFLLGKFTTDPDERGLNALNGWQLLIYDDDQIASLGSDIELQSRHGIRKAAQDQSASEFESLVNSVQGQMRLIRIDAKFFLAQCLFDNSNENAAGSWLDDLRNNSDDQRWQDGVNYLLGRSFESRKEYDQAIEIYRNEDLIQSHGNLLRARLLRQAIEQVYGDPS